jgi:hypothetical protein
MCGGLSRAHPPRPRLVLTPMIRGLKMSQKISPLGFWLVPSPSDDHTGRPPQGGWVKPDQSGPNKHPRWGTSKRVRTECRDRILAARSLAGRRGALIPCMLVSSMPRSSCRGFRCPRQFRPNLRAHQVQGTQFLLLRARVQTRNRPTGPARKISAPILYMWPLVPLSFSNHTGLLRPWADAPNISSIFLEDLTLAAQQ